MGDTPLKLHGNITQLTYGGSKGIRIEGIKSSIKIYRKLLP